MFFDSLIESTPFIHRPPFKALFCIWLISCFLALFALGGVPLRDFDEATVARVALELSTKSGLDRLLPTLWDAPYLNKPPGLHWFIALSIHWNRAIQGGVNALPSEFSIRFFPAIFSTFVVPLVGLIQWHLRPKDKTSSIISSLILLTLLPIVRYGRLAMLDGTQLSAIALLWFFLVSLDDTKRDKLRFLGAGFACSFMLLLKAPLMIPSLVAALIPLLWEKRFVYNKTFLYTHWFVFGLIPGASWHCWNVLSHGSGALWLWWGDGAGRVLFNSGTNNNLGFLVPWIELLEGGWPWILIWPFGLALAWSQLNTRWACWALGTQIVLGASILPLKTQLPWYIHPLWLPFSLLSGPPIAWLIQRKSMNPIPGQKFLKLVPLFLSLLGFILLLLSLIGLFRFNSWVLPYLGISIPLAISWLIGGIFLLHAFKKYRLIGFSTVVLGSLVALLFLIGSNLWLWELNENWDVRPVAKILLDTNEEEVFITKSPERPSLNWYAGKQIKSIDNFSSIPLFLNRNSKKTKDYDIELCRVIDNAMEWDLVRCGSKSK